MKLKIEHISFAYPSGPEVLKDLSLTVKKGEKVALLGLNGSGKSTLLLMTNGLLLPSKGRIEVGGISLEKKNLQKIRRIVGMVFQNADDQLFMSSVEEDVAFGPVNMGLDRREIESRVDEALGKVGLESLRKRNPAQLSGGQKRMASIATVLSMRPEILVLDEPTANLDWKARGDLLRILKEYEGICLVATHDLDLAAELCGRCIILQDGVIAADADTRSIIGDSEMMTMIGKETR